MQRQAGEEKSAMKREKKEKEIAPIRQPQQPPVPLVSAPLVSPQDYFSKMTQPVSKFQPFPTPPGSSGTNRWPDPPQNTNLEDTAKNLTQLGNLLTKVW